jgi:hypothetical protein
MELLFLENVKSVPKLFNESQVELLITFCYSIDFLINKIILNYILLSKIFTVFEGKKSIIEGGNQDQMIDKTRIRNVCSFFFCYVTVFCFNY